MKPKVRYNATSFEAVGGIFDVAYGELTNSVHLPYDQYVLMSSSADSLFATGVRAPAGSLTAWLAISS